ncbi:hypothetical protein ASPVEDRAFT_56153 [Aspergillus versicolor CBS 583.65]|uniref:CorA-like transporter domain-containing protein n=1 Tax=Aspergillus versicolor CBS 583.65 TaxID=1036611 RepID=A0A1L9PYG4_ASPVE|nr:uncharacterized protein ASPVEDRAFT_56153 [Aspergillus versicolor CBS 583.65]OJJ06554.1 hypothetical protein ASPVEDRAFT_56153 [Aspergillus versicolor CBS 583.65]
MSQMVTNIINEDETGYILKEKLEARLHLIFRYPIKVEHINGRYRFVAPRKVAPGIRPYLRYPAFISDSEKCNIYVFDNTLNGVAHTFTNSEIFESYIANTQKPSGRIISICCQNSLQPLRITEQAWRKLMSEYDLDPSLFELALSFGDKPRSSDAGLGALSVHQKENGAFDMHYLITYAEDTIRGGISSWKIRQTCVFHRHDPSGSGSLWVLLHANAESPLQKRIEHIIATSPAALLGQWFSMHLLALSTYLGGWRWYIRSLGDEIEKTVDIALTLDFSKPRPDDHMQGLVHLLKQQYLGDRILPLASRLRSTLVTLRQLEKMNSLLHSDTSTDAAFQTVVDKLTYHITSLEGNLEGINVLERKIRAISDLLAVSLTVENQAVTIDINNKMLDLNQKLLRLTDESLKGNTTVKTVTLVTLIYLPASFVSTLLGMNLFDYSKTGSFEISPQFWIFVVIAVPLTAVTVGSWYWFSRRKERSKDLNRTPEIGA